MTARIDLLRDAARSLRRARANLAAGQLGRAVEDLRQAQAAASYSTGMAHGLDIADGHYAHLTDCTAGMRRLLFHVEHQLVAALAPQSVDLDELVADIAEGIRVLRDRDGVPLTEAQILERARNIAASLVGNYDVRPLRGVSTNALHRFAANHGAHLASACLKASKRE